MADEIHKLTEKCGANSNEVWLNLCKVAERVISEFPCLITPHRDIGERCDMLSAYQIMRDNNCGIDEYDFSEEIISGEHVFSEKGKTELFSALSTIISRKNSVWPFTPVIQ